MNRRQFLGTSLGAAGGLLAPRVGRAASADRKFIFVYNLGGWDPTRVFAPEFSNGNVDMEPDAALSTAGGIPYVDHPDRPSVRSFINARHGQMTVLNGMLIRAISHDLCRMISLTGSSSGLAPDWPSIIAAGAADRYVLPHLVIAGPSYPAEYGALVARTGLNGQLDGLVSGRIMQTADDPRQAPEGVAAAAMDAFLSNRAAARAAAGRTGPDLELASAFQDASSRAMSLKALGEDMDWPCGP
jgi:hypothetical protein